ncbi:hypothetical protein Dxin01_00829 [Deinococcus xinjiangensis]|uniref:tRNA-guanine(15) transglycosylase-like domain-containing protein n=1 Tax=Deinococcus xinjiangensis TaxID=457454 RepID=A0ABP9VCR6_9DEIO
MAESPIPVTLPKGTPHGFIPVYTYRFPLDQLLRPYLEQLFPAALLSVTELRERGEQALPQMPLFIDSGGFLALNTDVTIQEEGGLGVLVQPNGQTISPRSIYDEQRWAVRPNFPVTAFTLDFPAPACAAAAERERRGALTISNARWTLSQIRPFRVFASLQPGLSPAEVLDLQPDGLALGGLAPYSADRERIRHEVRAMRALMPPSLPLHVFGLGHPQSVRAALEAGATTVDSSAPQRLAADGRSWTGEAVTDPNSAERLALALSNLLTVSRAEVPLHLHPLWRGVR